jgi:hypothetical protein
MYIDSVWHLYLVDLQTIKLIYLQNDIWISTNLIYQQTIFSDKFFAALIWTDEPAKKLSSRIYELRHGREREVVKPLR